MTYDPAQIARDSASLRAACARLARERRKLLSMLRSIRRFSGLVTRLIKQNVAQVEPSDVAWLFAPHARDGQTRVGAEGDLFTLKTARTLHEDGLGITFDQAKGECSAHVSACF